MSAVIERLENNRAKLTFGVDAEQFEKALQYAYNKTKSRFNIPGFRKGKAPRKIIEMQYGKEAFYDEAANHVIGEAYDEAADESGLDIVSRPEFNIEEIGTDKGVVFTAIVTLKPEIEIDGYKGLTYKELSLDVTEDEILAELNKNRELNAREITVTDRPVKDGDIVTIDYKGSLDGVPFEGGEDKDYDLRIGSKSFIDTFEEQLIGAEIGDDVLVKVTFPEEYHEMSLAGKEADFQVEIKDIRYRELPELDDDFAADVSEYDTLEEYRQSIIDELKKLKADNAENSKKSQIMDALVEKTEISVPTEMVESQLYNDINNMAANMKNQGLSFDLYLSYMGQTIEGLRNSLRPAAEKRVRGRLCLEAVAKAENIEITADEYEEELTRIAQEINIERDKMDSIISKREKIEIEMDLKVQKALELIVENSIAEAGEIEEAVEIVEPEGGDIS